MCVFVWGFSTCEIEDQDFYRGTDNSQSGFMQNGQICSDDQYSFTSLVFDTINFVTPEVVDLIQKFEMIMYNNVVSPRTKDVIFKRICFFMHKGLMTRLVICLSFFHV